MFPTIPVGPLALPTGPFLSLIAAVIGLEMMGRYGRREKLSADALWNVGLVTLLSGLIVARLWNVMRFGEIYLAEPLLIVSFRPSGFVLVPGIVGGLIGGYLFMLYRRMDPGPVAAAAAIGLVAGAVVQGLSGYLTRSVMGVANGGPAFLNPLDPSTHPVGIYRSLGMLLVLGFLWVGTSTNRPLHTLAASLLGYSLVRLIADGFLADVPAVGSVRVSQLFALGGALVACLILARLAAPHDQTTSTSQQLMQSTDAELKNRYKD